MDKEKTVANRVDRVKLKGTTMTKLPVQNQTLSTAKKHANDKMQQTFRINCFT